MLAASGRAILERGWFEHLQNGDCPALSNPQPRSLAEMQSRHGQSSRQICWMNPGSALEEIPHRRAKLRLLFIHRQMTRILDGLKARVLDVALELARVGRRN